MGELQAVYDRLWINYVKTTGRLLGALLQHYVALQQSYAASKRLYGLYGLYGNLWVTTVSMQHCCRLL
jgi:hypothetical protein